MDLQKYLEIIEDDKKQSFSSFKELLLNCNKEFNLTAICDEKGVLYKHFLDSLAGESLFSDGCSAIEIGSGAGFPSIPLKILREDIKFTLIESTGKKCTFLNRAVESLNLKCVQVVNNRAEECAKNPYLREKYDIACARAVARLNTLCEYCLPFVKVGGSFVAYKSDDGEEIAEAENAICVLGGRLEKVIDYELPESMGKRKLVVIKKVKPTPQKYPRGLGKERKNPL